MGASRLQSAERQTSESKAESRGRYAWVPADFSLLNHRPRSRRLTSSVPQAEACGHPCPRPRTIPLVGVESHGCPGTKSPERESSESKAESRGRHAWVPADFSLLNDRRRSRRLTRVVPWTPSPERESSESKAESRGRNVWVPADFSLLNDRRRSRRLTRVVPWTPSKGTRDFPARDSLRSRSLWCRETHGCQQTSVC